MPRIATRNNKNYKSLGIFLRRQKIINPYALTSLLIDKFVLCEKPGWQIIDREELIERKIISQDEFFKSWRYDITNKGILKCGASVEELKSNQSCYKANLFKPGKLIEIYIERAIMEFMPSRLELISDKFEAIDNRFENVDEKINNLENKVDKLTDLLLMTNPPDTLKRRELIKDNLNDLEKCALLLKDYNPNF